LIKNVGNGRYFVQLQEVKVVKGIVFCAKVMQGTSSSNVRGREATSAQGVFNVFQWLNGGPNTLMRGSGFGETRRPILRNEMSADPSLLKVDTAFVFAGPANSHLILHFGNCMMI
jgi:hypothetical protein